ncbi:MAG TPA: PrsW family glutamic-type intramembrane protease [Candidatus Saccharimonadales bacterium]
MLLFVMLTTFIGLAVGLAWFLISRDHGEKEPIGMLWLAAGFGMLGAVMAAFLENRLIPVSHLLPGASYGTLLPAALAVGAIEESCKFLPLAFVLYKRRYFNEYTDGVIYFALAGLGFGLPENLLYTLQFGTQTGLGRLLMTPFFHAAITGLIGYCLIRCKLGRRSPWLVGLPLLGAILVHGAYDFGMSSGSLLYSDASVAITLGVSLGLFAVFLRANDQDRERGLSVVGDNSFCRSCGHPNPHHNLYCAHCGKNA